MSTRALSRSAEAAVTGLGDGERRLDALVRRFDPAVRREARRLLRQSPRMQDLAVVFPGALHVLAAEPGSMRTRCAERLVESGAQLRLVAATLGLPMWLRRLSPEAFRGPLPRLPDSEAFARRIATRLPRSRSAAAFWLAAIAFAGEACDEELAIWLAEQSLCASQAPDPADAARLLAVLAAYAWFSRTRGTECQRLIVVPWRPELAFDTALCAAKSWLNRIRLVCQLKTGRLSDPWLEAGTVGRYSFTPLLDASALLAEAHRMHNCTDQYADRLARERCRLFAVRMGGESVATLEIAAHPREIGMLTITQLKSRHNLPAATDVWQAAFTWLGTQSGLRRLPALAPGEQELDWREFDSLLAPYRKARGGAPWLPARATLKEFARLDADIAELAARAGVTSWLFT